MNFAVQYATSGPRWFYFECDATDDQLHGLLKQLREHGDAFTLPEAAPSPDPAAGAPHACATIAKARSPSRSPDIIATKTRRPAAEQASAAGKGRRDTSIASGRRSRRSGKGC